MSSRAVIHDTLDALATVFLSESSPRTRLASAMPFLDGTHLATADYAIAARDAARRHRGGYGLDVRSVARLDGATIAEAQQFFGAFNPTRRHDLSAWQFEVCKSARVSNIVAVHTDATLNLLDPGGVRQVHTWVFPADHVNTHTMLRLYGLETWGDLPGGVAVQLWPSPGNIDRLGAAVTRAVALGTRTNFAWPTERLPSLADHLAREGLASLTVAARFPDALNPWSAPFTPASDWDHALATIATAAGVARYADLPVNVYGVVAPAGDSRLPIPVTPDAAEEAYARAVLSADLHETDPIRIAGHLYGDQIVALTGHPPVGMSPFAGIATAHTLVSEAMARQRLSLSSAVRLPTADLLDEAFA